MNPAFLFIAPMELLKLQVIAVFTFLAIGSPFPQLPVSLFFFVSLAMSRFLRSFGGRVIFRLGLNLFGLAATLLACSVLQGGLSLGTSFFSPGGGETLARVFVIAWIGIHWLRGAWLGARTHDHAFCVARFDEGIGVFLAVFSIAATLDAKSPVAERLVLPYFLFGILALGISRGLKAGKGGFSPRSRKAALIPFAVAFILAATGLGSLVPALQSPAAQAGEKLNFAFGVFMEWFGAFLLWLFRPRNAASMAGVQGEDSQVGPQFDPESASPFSTILGWILVALIAALVAATILFFLAMLFRFLFSRVEKRGGNPKLSSFLAWFRAFFLRCSRLFARLTALIPTRYAKRSEALETYARLLLRGRSAGRARRRTETPREYARRLIADFPRAAGDAGFIVDELEKEVYGGEVADEATGRRLVEARMRMRWYSFPAERARHAIGGAVAAVKTRMRRRGRRPDLSLPLVNRLRHRPPRS